MKVKLLRIKNFLGIREAELKPDGQSMLITGGNARGKTTILEAVRALFAGGIAPEQIHVGESESEVFADLGELTIDVTEKGVEVRTAEGVKVTTRVKGYLKELANALQTNPIAFLFLKSTEKRAAILRTMPIRVTRNEVADALRNAVQSQPETQNGNFAASIVQEFLSLMRIVDFGEHGLEVLSALYKGAYDVRHGIGSDLKAKRETLAAVKEIATSDYDPEAHQAVQSEFARIEDLRADADIQRETAERQASRVREIDAEMDALESKLAGLRGAREEARLAAVAAAEQFEQKLAIVKQLRPRDEVLGDLKRFQTAQAVADANAATVKKFEQVREEEQRLAARRAAYDVIVRVLEKDLPAAKLAEVGSPIPDLRITPEGVFVGDVPLETLNGAAQMQVAVAVAEASIPEGGAPILCIDGTERLDAEQMQILTERLSRGDIQGFVTRVTGGERVETPLAAPETSQLLEDATPADLAALSESLVRGSETTE